METYDPIRAISCWECGLASLGDYHNDDCPQLKEPRSEDPDEAYELARDNE